MLITKCASSVPDADFADFADLVHTLPIMDSWSVDLGQYYMMAHWHELM